MDELTRKIRQEAAKLLAGQVDSVIGFQKGTLPLRSAPIIIHNLNDVDKLVWNSFCANNLARYLRQLGERRVAIVAKGCDARSIVALIVENQLSRDQVFIIGVPCQRMIDWRQAAKAAGGEILRAEERDNELIVEGRGFKKSLPRDQFVYSSCALCTHRNPVIHDVLVGEPVEEQSQAPPPEIVAFEKKTPRERWDFYKAEMSRCIRCYACREACPMCYCEECFVDHSQPSWIPGSVAPSAVQIWQIVRAYHQAGRCTACGACERACPMNIPLYYLMKGLNDLVQEMFDFETGIDLESQPPLAVFEPDNVRDTAT